MHGLQFGWRQLCNTPGFAAVAVLTLAIGIRSTTAIFNVVNHVLLLPLPYHELGRLMSVHASTPNFLKFGMARQVLHDLESERTSFESMGGGAFWPVGCRLGGMARIELCETLRAK